LFVTAKGVVAMTGATGFVGKATVARLLEAGWEIRALTRAPQPETKGVSWVKGHLHDADALRKLCDGADAVLHIAGVVNTPDREGFFKGNVDATANLIAAAKSDGVNRFLYVSSLSAREPLLSNYGASKAMAEKLVGTSLLDWTIIRPPGVYGPGDSDGLDLFKMAARGFVLMPPAGRASWIHVDDLARLLVAALPSSEIVTARIFEADDGEKRGWSHKSYGRAIGWAVGKRVTAIAAPRAMLRLAAVGDRLIRRGRAKLTADRASYMSHSDWVIDPAMRPPRNIWEPQIQTRQGLKDTARWYRAHGWM
jgi:nucleoside-diphosphate-sugar epimerase